MKEKPPRNQKDELRQRYDAEFFRTMKPNRFAATEGSVIRSVRHAAPPTSSKAVRAKRRVS